MKIALVTDSTCDLPLEVRERLNAISVPLFVLFDGQNLRDGLEISAKDIFAGVKQGKKPPSTSQPSPVEFGDTYRKALESADQVLSLHISSKLSGTVGSAALAAKEFEGKVTVVDSLTTAGNLALLVMRASELIAAGKTITDIVATLERLKSKISLRFGVDTLEYLKMNGRIGGAAAMIGGLLGIKPVLQVVDGRVESAARVRGKNKMLEDMINYTKNFIQQNGETRIIYMHSDGDETTIPQIRAELLGLPLIEKGIVTLGAVIASHVGPGAIGVALEPENI
jgi:DegV family protein with EDD domain